MSRRRGELYRDPKRGKVAGVCAGLSDYFNMELWLVRIIFISAVLLLGGPFFIVAYIACWFILEVKPETLPNQSKTAPGGCQTGRKRSQHVNHLSRMDPK